MSPFPGRHRRSRNKAFFPTGKRARYFLIMPTAIEGNALKAFELQKIKKNICANLWPKINPVNPENPVINFVRTKTPQT